MCSDGSSFVGSALTCIEALSLKPTSVCRVAMPCDSVELQVSLGALSLRDRGRPLGLATAAGLSAGRQLPSQQPLLRARGERRSVRQKHSRAQRARKLARAFWWGARSALANPAGLDLVCSGVPPGVDPGSTCFDEDEYHATVARTLTPLDLDPHCVAPPGYMSSKNWGDVPA